MTCPSCQANVDAGARFCPNCGTAVDATVPSGDLDRTVPSEDLDRTVVGNALLVLGLGALWAWFSRSPGPARGARPPIPADP